jgi:hypothetical protein
VFAKSEQPGTLSTKLLACVIISVRESSLCASSKERSSIFQKINSKIEKDSTPRTDKKNKQQCKEITMTMMAMMKTQQHYGYYRRRSNSSSTTCRVLVSCLFILSLCIHSSTGM